MNENDKWLIADELATYFKKTRKCEIPAIKIGNQWHFNGNKINEWM